MREGERKGGKEKRPGWERENESVRERGTEKGEKGREERRERRMGEGI